MANVWKQFQRLIPQRRLTVGEVVEVNDDGTSKVELISGETIRASGDNVDQGSRAWIEGNRIVGRAPDLPVYHEDV